jgi:hypothetical protein
MNLDDPRMTAFALGELPPGERAEFEKLLRTDAQAAAEVAETKEIASILRGGLQAEEGAPLAEHQRAAIFRAASLAELEQRPVPAGQQPAAVVLTHPSWWNRPGPWQAIAACAVVGFGIYALSVPPVKIGGNPVASKDGFVVPTPMNDAVKNPGLASEGNTEGPKDPAGTSPTKTNNVVQGSNAVPPNIRVPIDVPVPSDAKNFAGSKGEEFKDKNVQATGIPKVDVKNRVAVPLNHNALKLDERFADMAKPKGTAPDGNQFLQERIAEAAQVQVGSNGDAFLKVFSPVPGAPQKYQMRSYPAIKVDAQFVDGTGHPTDDLPTVDLKLKSISKPYLEAGK